MREEGMMDESWDWISIFALYIRFAMAAKCGSGSFFTQTELTGAVFLFEIDITLAIAFPRERRFRMLEGMQKFLSPPFFEGDEERTYQARLLYVILWTQMLAFGFLPIAVILVLPEITIRFLLLTGIVDITSLGLLVLIRYGYSRLGNIVLTSFLWLLVTIYTLTAGGIHAPTGAVAHPIDPRWSDRTFQPPLPRRDSASRNPSSRTENESDQRADIRH